MAKPIDSLYQTCLDLVTKVGPELRNKFDKHQTSSQFKIDNSFITDLDVSIESKFIQELQQKYPYHNIVGEESGNLQIDSKYIWRIDPIDGTSNFLFGIPLYGIMLALEHQDEIIASAVNLPSLNLVISANKTSPTQINSKKILEYNATDLNKTTLITDSGKTKEGKHRYNEYMSKNGHQFRSIRQFGCVASHVAMLNSSHPFASLIVDSSAHDLSPVSLIFKQAGFITINAKGEDWSPKDRDLFSFHPSLDSEIIPTLHDLVLQ